MSDIKGGNLIEKSRPLVWAKFRDYTAGELRLLEVYLSRINPRDPETSAVRFTLKEYCDFLDIKINSRNLKAQVKHFVSNSVEVPRGDKAGSYDIYPLFDQASVEFDYKLANFFITLSCNPKLRPVFFDIAEKGYVRYRLRYTASMKSQYSILLYSILRDMIGRGIKTPEITVEKLREQLGANEPSYNEYRYLRKRVLDVAVKEINELSDLQVDYERVIIGHKVVSVKFNVHQHTEPVIDAESSEVIGSSLKDVPEDQRPVKKARRGAYEDVDWAPIAPTLTEKQCIEIAKSVAKRIKEKYPNIKQNKKKEAVVNIVENAYRIIIVDGEAERKEPLKNPGGYLFKTIEKTDLDDYATFDDSFLK